MKDQLQTIRAALEQAKQNTTHGQIAWNCKEALAALAQIEAAVGSQKPVGEVVQAFSDLTAISFADNGGKFPPVGTKLYAAPVAQQPQEIEVQCPVCNHKFYEWPNDKQPQAEAVPLTHVLVPVDEPTDEMVDAACAAVDGLCRVDFVRAYVAAFAHLKAGYRDESYWCGWNAAIKFQQAESAHQYNLANRLRVHLANRHTLTGPEFKDGVAGILAEYYTAPQQAEAVPTFDEQLREVAKRAIPQQAEAVPFNHATQLQIAYVKGLGDGAMQAEAVPPDVEVIRKALERAFIMGQNYWADADSESYSANKRSDVTRQKFNAMRDEVCAAIAQQKGQP